jgi:hypothetical protein
MRSPFFLSIAILAATPCWGLGSQREMELAREELAAALVNRQATIFAVEGRATKARV